MLGVWLAGVLAGVGFVRVGWSYGRVGALGGWALIVASLVLMGSVAGAWGISIGVGAASMAALLLLGHAALAAPAPARAGGPRRDPPSRPAPPIWSGMGRRLAVFVLTIPVAFVAAQGLAYAAHGAALRAGCVPADAIVLAMMVQPIAWGLIVTAQLTRDHVRRMWIAPAAVAALAALLWVVA